MSDLIDTTEMYLKTIFELEEEGVVPLRARIAERLHQSGPTVSQTVARMERDGLLHVDEDRHLELTDKGRLLATRVMRKHRLVERLLVDVIGLDWELVHNEACRWEHVVSEAVERRLVKLLHEPASDPYGNPIPGLSELDTDVEVEDFRAGVSTLRHASTADGVDVTIRHIGEPLQVDEKLLATLRRAEVTPGSAVRAATTDAGVELHGSETVELTTGDASHIFVSTS
ncbi:metal-dependent transcriptional regulator [Phytoactinopolyspora halotolerans]|uniref:Metal-dependent transcriptional regulator n=1 Tax=Phytoactinopolyspora halotolerans TaxID=1981512 RepID=A0A6L9S2C1_9ACTN|nr:metal-dependent transcriptional regulator [Phytoactinopolyspora halotolerans]NED98950.1 metal-dependent transcriptional regulator [Phytoactinopolyspora halotolerans]